MDIVKITNDPDKQRVTRDILDALPDWFGIRQARERYIQDSAG